MKIVNIFGLVVAVHVVVLLMILWLAKTFVPQVF